MYKKTYILNSKAEFTNPLKNLNGQFKVRKMAKFKIKTTKSY